jgi:recombination protein RecA
VLPMEKLAIRRAADLHDGPPSPGQRRFDYAAVAGRLVELSGGRGSASLGLLCSLVLEAQALGEPVVWVGFGDTIFFPPDVAANGVDLGSLAVVRAAGIAGALRAAHHLLHSGAFGLVILDAQEELVPQGLLGRFARLAEKNGTALVCLTQGKTEQGTEHGLGSMVSLRVRTHLHRLSPGVFRCEIEVIKDKRLGPGMRTTEVYRAPPGLR